MKNSKTLLTFLLAAIVASCNLIPNDTDHSVNAMIGDISFSKKYGSQPTQEANEDHRIQTHLAYVEEILRKKDISHLTPELREKRNEMLNLLSEYRNAGIFPRNYDHKDKRIPCFIDRDGRICAVGYLIEMTAGREVAENINSKFKYEYLMAMNDPKIDEWVSNSGLTKEECAMIQPNYGFNNGYVSTAYSLSSSMVSGLNLSLNTINGIQIANGTDNRTVPVIGLITGTGQVIMGTAAYITPNGNFNNRKTTLAMVNIGFGTSTIIMSSWNLLSNRPPQDNPTTFNISSFPTPESTPVLAFGFTRSF